MPFNLLWLYFYFSRSLYLQNTLWQCSFPHCILIEKYETCWDSFNKKGYTCESHHQQYHCLISPNFTCLQWRHYIWFTQSNTLLQLVGRVGTFGCCSRHLLQDEITHTIPWKYLLLSIMHHGVLAWPALMSHKHCRSPREYTADTYNHPERPHPASLFNSLGVLWD